MKPKDSRLNENVYRKDKPYKGTFGSQLEELYSENLPKEIEQELAQPQDEEESTKGRKAKGKTH